MGNPQLVESPSLHDLLWRNFSKLQSIKRRLHFLQAFSETVETATRGKPFRIRNDIVYNMVLDVRDKCVIDLYSCTVGMRHGVRPLDLNVNPSRQFLRKKGFFLYLRDFSTSLNRVYVRQPDDWDDEMLSHTRSTADRFKRLFPDCEKNTPSSSDIDQLCERFRLKMHPLGKDRNKNRAHVHEGDMGNAKMHSFPELAELFEYTEDLVEDLSLLGTSTSFARQNLNHASAKRTSENIVDLILLGNVDDITRWSTKRTREELYTRLHEFHESNPKGKRHFNDRQYDLDIGL